MNKTVLFIGLIACVALASSGTAHQPWFNPGSPSQERAFRVQEPEVSKVITAEARANGQNWYVLDVPEGFQLDVAIFKSAACANDFNPRLWVVGPGLEGPSRAPFKLPDGMGVLEVAQSWSPYSGYGLNARRGPTFERRVKAGRYYYVVDHGAKPGWYFLSLGGSEISGAGPEGRAALTRFNRCG